MRAVITSRDADGDETVSKEITDSDAFLSSEPRARSWLGAASVRSERKRGWCRECKHRARTDLRMDVSKAKSFSVPRL